MAFAIFYNSSDLSAISDAVTAASTGLSMTLGQRLLATEILANGLTNWVLASVSSVERQEGDADTRTVTIVGVALADMISLLSSIRQNMGILYMAAIADDMSRSSGAQEPYP